MDTHANGGPMRYTACCMLKRSDARKHDTEEPVEGEVLEDVPPQKRNTGNPGRQGKILGSRYLPWIGLFLLLLPAIIFITVVLVFGMWGEYILPVLSDVVVPLLAVAALILVVLTFFDATKQRAAHILYVGTWAYWLAVWMLGFLVTSQYWGAFAVILGLVFFGVGVIPLGVFAAVFHGDSQAFLDIVTLLLLAVGSRRVARQIRGPHTRSKKVWKYFRS